MAIITRYIAAFLITGALFGLLAQAPTARLVGTVVDSSGALIAGAKLEIRSAGTNESSVVISDHKGEFTIPNLAPVTYEVVITKEGFRTLHEKGVVLQMDQAARMEFRMEVGAISQSVDVTASVPLINTENSVKGEVMVNLEIVEMPLDGRDFTDLSFFTPGVLPAVSGGQGSSFHINGARSDNTNFVIDGFNDQNARTASAQARPNIDALDEFKMQTTGYSAELGRLAGGVMNMVLKSGTNQLHGTAFYFARNDVFDARNFFDVEKSPLNRQQPGGTVSGPVVVPKLYNGRNHTFFLFSWESSRQTGGINRLGILPTDAQKQGDFSGFVGVKDPMNKNAVFPGNRIPSSRFDPVAVKAEAFLPAVNLPGQVNNFRVNVDKATNWDSDVIKIDQRISDKDSLSFRWLKRYNRNTNPFNGSDTGAFGDSVRSHQTLGGITYTRTLSPTLINEGRFGFTRTTSLESDNHAGTDYNHQLGLPSPADPTLFGFPRFVITNYEALGAGANVPVQFTINSLEWTDTVTWVKGRHLFKLGGDILRTQFFQPFNDNNRGTFNFTGAWTGEPYADFLMGLLNSDSHHVGTSQAYLFSTNYSFFAQDDWKLTSRLTLNLGLRYELPTPPVEKYGRYSNFVPELGQLVFASDASFKVVGATFSDPTKVTTAAKAGLPDALIYTRRDDFAPRFGLAWRPFGGNHTVIRGGYGIFFGSALQNPVRNSLANVFPFSITQSISRKAADPTYLTLQSPFPVPPNLLGAVTNVNGYELHAKTPSVQSWNLTLERQIGWESAIEIGYVGSKGSHLGRQYNLNQPYRSAALAPNFPFPYPAFGTMNYYGFNSNSSYNAGEVTFRRRFSHGVFYRVSYAYSKSIDDTSYLSAASDGGYLGAQDVRNLHGDRGRSDWDAGHAFTLTLSWNLPWKRNVLVRGWQISGSGHAYTGTPLTPQLSNVNLNLGEANRPNRTGKGALANPTVDMWYNLAAFPPVPTGSFAFGNSGRNILDAPGSVALNTTLARNFRISERHRIQFRWEVFNITNHPNLAVPNVYVNQPNAGTITSAGDGRLMQFGLRYMF